jgi:ParB family transcriptional regulator, chromosome partitioning protein
MASFNQSMRSQVASSMNDRPAPEGSSGEARFTVNRSAMERQGDGRKRLDSASMIRLDRIVPDPAQPRTEFDPEALEMLAASLKARGQLQPIRVRWDDQADRYVVVVGERRFRAAALAGMESIACVVASGVATPEDLLEDQLVENALREDLRPVEQARAYRTLLAARGLTHRQLAERLQIGHASIARALALLDLPEPIQAEVEAGSIAPNTAYELSKVADPAEQADLARQAAEGRLRRDEIKGRTRASTSAKGRGAGKGKAKPPTSRLIRLDGGFKLTVENRRGFNARALLAALREAAAKIEAELADDQVAA